MESLIARQLHVRLNGAYYGKFSVMEEPEIPVIQVGTGLCCERKKDRMEGTMDPLPEVTTRWSGKPGGVCLGWPEGLRVVWESGRAGGDWV